MNKFFILSLASCVLSLAACAGEQTQVLDASMQSQGGVVTVDGQGNVTGQQTGEVASPAVASDASGTVTVATKVELPPPREPLPPVHRAPDPEPAPEPVAVLPQPGQGTSGPSGGGTNGAPPAIAFPAPGGGTGVHMDGPARLETYRPVAYPMQPQKTLWVVNHLPGSKNAAVEFENPGLEMHPCRGFERVWATVYNPETRSFVPVIPQGGRACFVLPTQKLSRCLRGQGTAKCGIRIRFIHMTGVRPCVFGPSGRPVRPCNAVQEDSSYRDYYFPLDSGSITQNLP